MNLKPTQDCIIVKPDMEKHKLFILLREKKTGEGTVLAIGPETKDIEIGDKIVFGEFVGQEFKWENDDLLVMREEHVLGVLE